MKRGYDSLIEVYAPTFAKVWFRLNFCDGGDLVLHQLEVETVGEKPEWIDSFDDAVEFGYGGMFGSGCDFMLHGHTVHGHWIQWAFEHGVAPGQPFLLGLYPPEVSYSYDGEYDEEWGEPEFLELRPWPRRLVLKRWEHFWRRLERECALGSRFREEAAERLRRDVSAMYVQLTSSFAGDYNSQERWVRLRVQSRHHVYNPHFLGSVEDAWGEGYKRTTHGEDLQVLEEMAFPLLVESACKANMYLSPELIRSLPVERR